MSIVNTNNWSCLLDSFAFATEIPSATLISIIGHDGAGTGFHTQELIEAVAWGGFAVTEIERYPVARHPYTEKDRLITFKGCGGVEHRFARHLNDSRGVLLGLNVHELTHAVAWRNNLIHDSATGESSTLLSRDSRGYLLGVNSQHPFSPAKFLKVTSIP